MILFVDTTSILQHNGLLNERKNHSWKKLTFYRGKEVMVVQNKSYIFGLSHKKGTGLVDHSYHLN